ncbi:hypothetical protein DH2020_005491 [Rehmannia glutinosa]|uniref:HMA domain-containing protein n=1 Tax=Rehmannia glutinosa TaxID=99300 RepID=A0ABR0XGA2_REHGL
MAAKFLSLACIRPNESGNLSPRPHYPSMPKYPKGVVVSSDEEKFMQGSEAKALFSVTGMTCSACAGSVEKAVKRLPGIKEAAVDVLNNRAQVTFFPAFVNEETIRETIEDVGFEASLIKEEMNEKSSLICRIRIKGMTCTSCSSTVESGLQALRGVQRAQVALATEEAEVRYDPKILTYNQILEAVEDTGFEAILISTGEDRCKIHLHVEGVRSENSMRIIGNSLEALPGVQEMNFDLELNKLSLSYQPDLTGPRNFIEIIESTGSGRYKAKIFPEGESRGSHRAEEIKQYYKSFLWSLVFTIPVFLLSMVFMYIPGIKHGLDTKIVNMLNIGEILRWILSTPVQFIIGRRFYIGAYKALRHGTANMDVLIALGTNAAYFYSVYSVLRAATSPSFESTDFFETSSMLISFILLGKYLEVLAKGKTSEAIEKLMDLAPERATLLTLDSEGNVLSEVEIDSRLIQKNDVMKIVPGAKVACDGFVIWGQSHVNESMITGESRPVAKRKGDVVIGGTLNTNGVLHVKATKVGSESALAQIVRLVESAQMAKAPVQKLADRISKFFVPLVRINCFLHSNSINVRWAKLKLDSDLQFAARTSVWHIRYGNSMSVCTWLGYTGYRLLWLIGVGASQGVLIKGGQALESTHKVNCIVFDKTGTLTVGKPVVVNTRLFKNMVLKEFFELVAAAEVNSEHPLAKAIVEHAKKFRQDEENLELVGIIAISDPLKPGAREVISFLKSMKVRSIVVTGDNWGTANAIAKEVGIDTVIAEAKPEHKAEKVKELQKQMWEWQSAQIDIAVEAADIVSMKSNLEDVISAIDLSRKTFLRIRLNYLWALGYNVLGIPIASLEHFSLPIWIPFATLDRAGAAMAASSAILSLLGFKEVDNHGKYLGLPSIVGRSKKEIFGYIKDNIWKRIQGWSHTHFSKAGKEILIKSVLQAIPTYAMSCFKFPDSVISDIPTHLLFRWETPTHGNYIGTLGTPWHAAKIWGALAFVLLKHLIWLYYPSKPGESYRTPPRFSHGFSKPNISTMGRLWTHKLAIGRLGLGEVSIMEYGS